MDFVDCAHHLLLRDGLLLRRLVHPRGKGPKPVDSYRQADYVSHVGHVEVDKTVGCRSVERYVPSMLHFLLRYTL